MREEVLLGIRHAGLDDLGRGAACQYGRTGHLELGEQAYLPVDACNLARVPLGEVVFQQIYLKELRSIGLVSREMPVVAGSRRAVYRLSDSLFRFWYRFVLPNRTAIERGMQQRVLRSIQAGLPAFCGPVFENVCAQWLWVRNADGSLPVEFGDLGRWWGNDRQLREEAEIDLVSVDDGRTVLVGECKWRNEDVDRDVIETLEHRSGLVHALADSWLYAFSKSGFTRGAVEAAASHGHVRLVSFDEMCGPGK